MNAEHDCVFTQMHIVKRTTNFSKGLTNYFRRHIVWFELRYSMLSSIVPHFQKSFELLLDLSKVCSHHKFLKITKNFKLLYCENYTAKKLITWEVEILKCIMAFINLWYYLAYNCWLFISRSEIKCIGNQSLAVIYFPYYIEFLRSRHPDINILKNILQTLLRTVLFPQ